MFRRTLGYYWLIFCTGLNLAVLGPSLLVLAAQTQARPGDMGQVFLAGAMGATLGTLAGGRLFGKLHGHIVLGAAQMLSGLMMLCMPFMLSLGWLLAVAAIKGMMDGIVNNGITTMLVWTHHEKVSPYINGLHFSFGVGAFISPLLVAQVIDIPGAYRWIFAGLACFTVISGLCTSIMRGNPLPARQDENEAGAVNYRHVPLGLALTAALFLFFYVGAELAFGGWVYTYAVELRLGTAAQAAYLTSGFWLAFTIGRLFSVPMAIRYTPRQITTVALLGCVFAVGLVLIFSGSLAVLWAAALGTGFFMGPVYPSGYTLAVQRLRLTAAANSLILMGECLGAIVIPWLVGQMLESAGPRAMVHLVFASLILNLVAFACLLHSRSRIRD